MSIDWNNRRKEIENQLKYFSEPTLQYAVNNIWTYEQQIVCESEQQLQSALKQNEKLIKLLLDEYYFWQNKTTVEAFKKIDNIKEDLECICGKDIEDLEIQVNY